MELQSASLFSGSIYCNIPLWFETCLLCIGLFSFQRFLIPSPSLPIQMNVCQKQNITVANVAPIFKKNFFWYLHLPHIPSGHQAAVSLVSSRSSTVHEPHEYALALKRSKPVGKEYNQSYVYSRAQCVVKYWLRLWLRVCFINLDCALNPDCPWLMMQACCNLL